MRKWAKPEFSRSRVKAAGLAVRDGTETEEDIVVVENWRASHAYIINTFQANLRLRCKNKPIKMAQRLKRQVTIFDKLKRFKDMKLNTMHDIAGCRLVFENLKDLRKFKEEMDKARFKHSRKEVYDYLNRPKDSGYRGIHEIYAYNTSSSKGRDWKDLKIEIQYRTKFQHAWATALEVNDFITSDRVKFGQAESKDIEEYFQIVSEIIARKCESSNSCFPSLKDEELVNKYIRLEERTKLLTTLNSLKKSAPNVNYKHKYFILINTLKNNVPSLKIESFEYPLDAAMRYNDLEKQAKIFKFKTDVVLVYEDIPNNIKTIFKNYFSDVSDFIKYVQLGVNKMQESIS